MALGLDGNWSFCRSIFAAQVLHPLYPFSAHWESGLTLGLLRGLEDRPVEAPLTLRDLFPGQMFKNQEGWFKGSGVLSLPHSFKMRK